MIKKINTKAIFEYCKVNNLIDPDITYQEFYHITREFNKSISAEVIDGYIFSTIFGTFQIVKRERRRRYIDWGRSNKKKQEIIDAGGIPFHKKLAPNGVDWFIFFTSEVTYLWKWIKTKGVNAYYLFNASWDNRATLGQVVNKKIELQTENYAPFQNGF